MIFVVQKCKVMKHTIFQLSGSFLLLVFLISCNNNQAQSTEENGNSFFGEKIDDSGAITYDDMLAQLATTDSLEVKVEGLVESVCQTKGCWVNIVSENDTTQEPMFVKFKVYGFFLPKDCSGQKVVMEGKAYREVTSVDELKHYAEDEGKTPEEIAAIVEPVEELKFMASGVILKK